MAYAELAELIGYLSQFRDEAASNPDLEVLDACLDRAAALLNLDLGVDADLTAAAVDTRVLYGDGGLYLSSTEPMSSVTEITAPTGYTVPDYVLQKGTLRITDSTGLLSYPYSPNLSISYWYGTGAGWLRGVPYTVTATFGYSATVMAALQQANLEGAVALWNFKDAGGMEAVGEGPSLEIVKAAWSPKVTMALAVIRRKTKGNPVGVW